MSSGSRPRMLSFNKNYDEWGGPLTVISDNVTNDNVKIDNINTVIKDSNNTVISDTQEIKKEKRKYSKKNFVPPLYEDVERYCVQDRRNTVDPRAFFDYYSVSNWIDREGRPVSNWKQKVITWEGNSKGVQRENIKLIKTASGGLQI